MEITLPKELPNSISKRFAKVVHKAVVSGRIFSGIMKRMLDSITGWLLKKKEKTLLG